MMTSAARRHVNKPPHDITDIVDVIAARVELKRAGTEWSGLCPFHSERSPSFTVSQAKQFFHCFGCGAHGDAIDFVQRIDGVGFAEACAQLSVALSASHAANKPRLSAVPQPVPTGSALAVMMPAPEATPAIQPGVDVSLWNAKRGRVWRCRPSRADAYRDARGQLLGCVLRIEFIDGAKVTPQVTWCLDADGVGRWCVRPFLKPRPLQGLDALASRPHAPVLVVEGEKCRAAGAAALTPYVVVTWPGGSKGVPHVDWSPLKARHVVLWPDADDAGRDAMLGFRHYNVAPAKPTIPLQHKG